MAATYRDQFAVANGYMDQVTPPVALPAVAAPVPVVEPDTWSGPVSGERHAAGMPGWGGLKPDVQGYASAVLTEFPGLRFTSGHRDPVHNARVGGVPNSAHITGRAADFVGTARQMYDAAAWAKLHGARHVLVHNAGSGMHLHIEW